MVQRVDGRGKVDKPEIGRKNGEKLPGPGKEKSRRGHDPALLAAARGFQIAALLLGAAAVGFHRVHLDRKRPLQCHRQKTSYD